MKHTHSLINAHGSLRRSYYRVPRNIRIVFFCKSGEDFYHTKYNKDLMSLLQNSATREECIYRYPNDCYVYNSGSIYSDLNLDFYPILNSKRFVRKAYFNTGIYEDDVNNFNIYGVNRTAELVKLNKCRVVKRCHRQSDRIHLSEIVEHYSNHHPGCYRKYSMTTLYVLTCRSNSKMITDIPKDEILSGINMYDLRIDDTFHIDKNLFLSSNRKKKILAVIKHMVSQYHVNTQSMEITLPINIILDMWYNMDITSFYNLKRFSILDELSEPDDKWD